MNLLDISGLSVAYGGVPALEAITLSVGRGEIVGIVGESGSGKSTLALAVPRLLPPTAQVTAGRILLDGIDLLSLDRAALRDMRGGSVAMVFQDPATSFSPLAPIGRQLEILNWRDRTGDRAAKRRRIAAMLADVGIADPERRLDAYPHELSGGMLQRIAIAAALLASPALMIADEPTTALDVTTEAQILHLLRGARDRHGTAILVISHQLGVIAEICDRVAVMYGGVVVEEAPVEDLFGRPAHPYTRALLACEPGLLPAGAQRLPVIPGIVSRPTVGCRFADRCGHAEPDCRTTATPVRSAGDGHTYLCMRAA
ncbi:MAG TPA: ABC transporter ATP-binding protein [Alphaproteobacteria bacterium]|jgi:peptide/nickel transport system ATP-binding protein|nr:ABC transporter ATP-binding protein [Alphaproteobacteria bacterium]